MRRYLVDNAAKPKKRNNMYIHERENWTNFRWDVNHIASLIEQASRQLGLLYGRLGNLGVDSKLKAMAENLTHDVVFSSEIEGITLNEDEVRSSIAHKLGIQNLKYTSPSHYIDGVVNVMLDAVEHYDRPITKQILCRWQTAFFPTGYSEGTEIEVGHYRTNNEHIISGFLGRERVHYVAPSPERLEVEMQKFIQWFNTDADTAYIIRSAVAHFWFVSIHPFEDGNGRLARILSDMMLARGDKNQFRFYNISSAINKDKRHYYDILERAQKDNGDLTEWIKWYVETLIAALTTAQTTLNAVLNKSVFLQRISDVALTDRQMATLTMFLDGYESKITTKQWATLNKCSKDTANRDIQDLVKKHILAEDIPEAKRPSYSIVYLDRDITPFFSDVKIQEINGVPHLKAKYKNGSTISLPIQQLDAQRYDKGDLPLPHLLNKYCAFLVCGDR